MKEEYEEPKVERLDFDYADNVAASGPALTDTDGVAWKCETRIVDVKNIEGTVCGYL